MEFTLTFLKLFFFGLYLAAPLLLTLLLAVIVLGLIVGKKESWTRFDAVYWSFVTSTTLGYGDFRPIKKISKVLAIFIALTGIIFSGILVAIAVNSALYSFKTNMDMDAVETSIQSRLRVP